MLVKCKDMIIPCCSVWQKALNKLKIQMLYDKKSISQNENDLAFLQIYGNEKDSIGGRGSAFCEKRIVK